MANICENRAIMEFRNSVTVEKVDKILEAFKKDVCYSGTLECDDDYEEMEDISCILISYDTKWHAQKNLLQKFADDWQVDFHVSAFEPATFYTDALHIYGRRTEHVAKCPNCSYCTTYDEYMDRTDMEGFVSYIEDEDEVVIKCPTCGKLFISSYEMEERED